MLREENRPAIDPRMPMATQTTQYDRVRALHWCPRCFGVKDAKAKLLVCGPCNTRLKRAYDGGHGPMEWIYPDLDLYLANHRDSEAISWLGGA
jgi:hypothetical protein